MSLLLTTIATEVAGEFGSRLSAILAPSRGRPEDARARAISMFVYERLAGGPCMSEVGRVFGRDRTTVRHALTRVEGFLECESGFDERLESVIGRVRARS